MNDMPSTSGVHFRPRLESEVLSRTLHPLAGRALRAPAWKRFFVLGFSSLTYAFFFGVFLYTIGFIANAFVPKAIDSGTPGSWPSAFLVNGGFLALFAVQHTIMARPAFKKRWTKIVSPALERSLFVLATCLILVGMFWQWRALPQSIWSVDSLWLQWALTALSLLGWGLVFVSTFAIDHFELFGLKQAYRYFRGTEPQPVHFVKRGPYGVVRHPLMLGFMVAFWATPSMSQGHLFFAVMVTLYILVGVRIEERDLVRQVGKAYRDYQASTPGIIPFLKR